jgi:hypothetical protein
VKKYQMMTQKGGVRERTPPFLPKLTVSDYKKFFISCLNPAIKELNSRIQATA